MANFVNLTPHVVRVVDNGNNIVAEFPAAAPGTNATVKTRPNIVRTIDNIPMSVTAYDNIVNLPDPQHGTLYIVSTMVFAHPDVQSRTDLVVPDSGPDAIRQNGQPYAVRRFTVRQ